MNDDRIEGTTKKVVGTVQNAFGNAIGDESQQIKGTSKKIAGSVQDTFGKADEFLNDSIESVHARILEKPVQSAVVALLIGAVIGKLYL